MIEKIKFTIARVLDRLLPVCWAELVMWALGFRPITEVDFSGKRCKPGGADFIPDAGGCYCGKYRTEADE